jgi:hypothetical protein
MAPGGKKGGLPMQASPALRKTGTALLLLASTLPLSCSDEATVPPTDPYDEARNAAERLDLARPAQLYLTVEDAAYEYIGRSKDPWLFESIVTDAGSMSVVVRNASRFDVRDVTLIVAIDEAYLHRPGWQVEVNGRMLGPGDFAERDLKRYGFREGPHGVYPPRGRAIFYPYTMEGVLFAHGTWIVPLRASTGGNDGFRVHLDVGSSRLSNTTRNDITVVPPPEFLSPIVACCFADGRCEVMTENDCVEFDGISHGAGSTCDDNPCGGSPVGACCRANLECVLVTEQECEELDGSWLGEDFVCDPNPCGE